MVEALGAVTSDDVARLPVPLAGAPLNTIVKFVRETTPVPPLLADASPVVPAAPGRSVLKDRGTVPPPAAVGRPLLRTQGRLTSVEEVIEEDVVSGRRPGPGLRTVDGPVIDVFIPTRRGVGATEGQYVIVLSVPTGWFPVDLGPRQSVTPPPSLTEVAPSTSPPMEPPTRSVFRQRPPVPASVGPTVTSPREHTVWWGVPDGRVDVLIVVRLIKETRSLKANVVRPPSTGNSVPPMNESKDPYLRGRTETRPCNRRRRRTLVPLVSLRGEILVPGSAGQVHDTGTGLSRVPSSRRPFGRQTFDTSGGRPAAPVASVPARLVEAPEGTATPAHRLSGLGSPPGPAAQ